MANDKDGTRPKRRQPPGPRGGWTPEALDRRERAIGRNPWGGYNHNTLGVEFFQMRRWDMAIKEFTRAVEINPWKAVFKGNLARACLAAGDLAWAERWAYAALRQEPELPVALFTFGLLYEERKEPLKAMEYYRRCLAAKPDVGMRRDAEENLALLLKETGQA